MASNDPKPAARNILIRAPNWVGDVVMATASFADVRRTFPEARITVLNKFRKPASVSPWTSISVRKTVKPELQITKRIKGGLNMNCQKKNQTIITSI